jgi:hypothetical protein
LDGASLEHFFYLFDEIWITTVVGNHSIVGLRLQPHKEATITTKASNALLTEFGQRHFVQRKNWIVGSCITIPAVTL